MTETVGRTGMTPEEIEAWTRKSVEAHGLSVHVSDPAILDRAAAIANAARREDA